MCVDSAVEIPSPRQPFSRWKPRTDSRHKYRPYCCDPKRTQVDHRWRNGVGDIPGDRNHRRPGRCIIRILSELNHRHSRKQKATAQPCDLHRRTYMLRHGHPHGLLSQQDTSIMVGHGNNYTTKYILQQCLARTRNPSGNKSLNGARSRRENVR